MPAISLASSAAGHGGPSSTLLNSPIRLVAPAATASATVSAAPGYAIRPTVPSVEKPASSALAAHGPMIRGSTLRTWFGIPIPIFTDEPFSHSGSCRAPRYFLPQGNTG